VSVSSHRVDYRWHMQRATVVHTYVVAIRQLKLLLLKHFINKYYAIGSHTGYIDQVEEGCFRNV